MFDAELLERYLKEDNKDAAKQMLQDYFAVSVEDDEKAEAYLLIAEIYMRTSNDINEQYLEDLKAATTALQALKDSENQADDDIALAQARHTLK